LRGDTILEAARRHGAEAVHPGYGFLSENAEFAESCGAAGVVFVGPSPAAIRAMGSKTAARTLAIAAGAPVVPGTEKRIQSPSDAKRIARELGYPVLIKAAAGGGGKGMREVDREEDLESALRDAASEALRSFRNDEVYLEKLVVGARHVEIQLLGDHHGHMIHLGERECSIQRRHQKVIEECPSPLIQGNPELRSRMGEAALKIARAAEYTNAGTMEFLVDRDLNFYFLEMNTRLQVEHPVTELATGIDLVEWQLRIAAGERLTIRQEDVSWRGSAIECRVYAEDPENGFMPSPGKITFLREPSGPGVRLDSGIYPGWTVPVEYDPLLTKLIAWAPSREHATARLDRALAEYAVGGIHTNLTFFREVLADPEFRAGRLSTAFLDGFFARRAASKTELAEPELAAEAAAALFAAHALKASSGPAAVDADRPSRWVAAGRESQLR
jgi:acetyl-CoA carboxylase biotin carboxylase subunit